MIHQVNNDDADDDGDDDCDGGDNPSGEFLVIIIINNTRPIPAYGRQDLVGEIMGPGYSSSGYILGFISYCNLEFRHHLLQKPVNKLLIHHRTHLRPGLGASQGSDDFS